MASDGGINLLTGTPIGQGVGVLPVGAPSGTMGLVNQGGSSMAGIAGPIISAGIGGGLNFAGGKAQADAERYAAQQQAQTAQQAINEKAMEYQGLLTRLAPFQQAGAGAATTLSQRLARPYQQPTFQLPTTAYLPVKGPTNG